MWNDGELFKLRCRKGRCIEVQYRHKPGLWYSTHTNNENQAAIFADKHLEQAIGIRSSSRAVTFGEFAKDFFSIRDPHGWRLRNERYNKHFDTAYYNARQGYLNNYILPHWEDMLITAITDVAIEDWFLNLHSVQSGKMLADNSKNKILMAFRIILQEAKRQRLIKTNPAADVTEISAEIKAREPFNTIELYRMFPQKKSELLRIWGGPGWACYFLVMRDTGWRPGEVAALTRSCYYKALRGIYSERSIDYRTRGVKQSIKTTAKGQKYKVGILTTQTAMLLEELIEQTPRHEQFLFRLSPRGMLLCPDVANKHLKASLHRAGVETQGRTQYSLRHSFETDIAGKIEDSILLELMAHTGYRAEYDHRTPEQMLKLLQPVRDVLENR